MSKINVLKKKIHELPTGKRKICENHANAGTLILKNRHDKMLTINLRAYDDVIAFNYEVKC